MSQGYDNAASTYELSASLGAESIQDVEPSPSFSGWGFVFYFNQAESVALENTSYSFGRASSCDVCFEKNFSGKPHFPSLSQTHFELTREKVGGGDTAVTLLKDLSTNGTYVNGIKIGKGKCRQLKHNDEISIAVVTWKAFLYLDEEQIRLESRHFPSSMRSKYFVSKLLGKGAMGEVKLGIEKATNQFYAVKAVQKCNLSKDNSKHIEREKAILQSIKHPCVVAVREVFETNSDAFFVMELVEGGELFDRIVEKQRLKEGLAKLYFYQMLKAIEYLHRESICHRDLKPENILVTSTDDETLIKISDFGLSKFTDDESMMKTHCGTPAYLAPEIILNDGGVGSYTNAVDMWSLGVILFVMLSGYPPFSREYNMDINEQIITGAYRFEPRRWKGVSSDAISMFKGLLKTNPEKRFTVTDALTHKWLQDNEMKAVAHGLMWPGTEGMIPPSSRGSPKKRKGLGPDVTNGCDSSSAEDSVDSRPLKVMHLS